MQRLAPFSFLGFTAMLEGACHVKLDGQGAPTFPKGLLFAYGGLVALANAGTAVRLAV